MTENAPQTISRRSLLKGVGAALAAPTIIPASALGKDGAVAPSNRIVMGTIGTGAQGMGNMRSLMGFKEVQMVAVCDVDSKRCERAQASVNSKYRNKDCKTCVDFREITRRTDIDAVCIATPDHWHAIPAIDAARHGKDMYVQKPLTLTIHEGRVLADTVQRYGRILQTGSQQRSDSRFRFACELVRNGRLGKLERVDVGIPGNNKRCEPTWTPATPPPELDYDMWLGPAPWAPYHPQRCHYQFRFILDYSGGQVTNFGAHNLDIAQWGLGMDDSGPVEIVGKGEFPKTGLFTTATRVNFECTYANGVRVTCKTGGGGATFRGDKGWVYVTRGRIKANPESLLKEKIGPDEIHLYVSRNHFADFVNCVKTRRKPICHEEVGHRSSSVCHLGNIAMLLNRRVKWDPVKEEFPGDDAANRMRSRMPRSPWTVC